MAQSRSRGKRIMSVLWLIVWTAIAVALVKFAFFPSIAKSTGGDDGLDPHAEYTELIITPTTQTVINSLKLQGTIRQAEPVSAKSPLDGEVIWFFHGTGDQVEAGERILQVRKQVVGDDVITTDEEGNQIIEPGQSWWEYEDVVTTTSGTVTIDVLMSQPVGIGETVASVQPPTYLVHATLEPEQMYRLQELPSSVTATIKDGPAPFDCTNAAVVTPQDTTDSESAGAETMQLQCTVPGNVTVFPGLQVQLEVISGEVEDALTLPLSAVEGRFSSGFVYVPGPDGEPIKTEVTLGISDEYVVQIKSGISADEQVLEFVPGQTTCVDDPSIGFFCDEQMVGTGG